MAQQAARNDRYGLPGIRRRAAWAVLLVPLVALTLALGTVGRPVTAAAASVTIQNFAFSPASVTIAAGETVTWTNQDSATHTVTADDGSFDSGAIAGGGSFSMTFSQPGTFAYHCSIHPFMHGTVMVTAAAQPAPAATTAPTSAAAANVAHFKAGYNLVGVPSGTALQADAVEGFDPASNSYQPLAAGQSPQGGAGYWAFYSADTNVSLPAGSNAPVTVNAPAGAWLLVGDPSGTQPATVTGADAAWKYNPASGSYVPGTVLNPGEGAWVISMAGGRITVTPGGTTAATLTASPSPSPTPRPATSAPPPTTSPATQPTMAPPYHYPGY